MATNTSNKTLRDSSNPTACAAYLSAVLKDIVRALNTQEKLNEAMARYQLLDYRGRLGNQTKGASGFSKTEAKAKTALSPAGPTIQQTDPANSFQQTELPDNFFTILEIRCNILKRNF